VFIARGDLPYSGKGRFHTEEEARGIDRTLLEQLTEWFPEMRRDLQEHGHCGTPILNAIVDSSQKQEIFDIVIRRFQDVTISDTSRELVGSLV